MTVVAEKANMAERQVSSTKQDSWSISVTRLRSVRLPVLPFAFKDTVTKSAILAQQAHA